MKGKVIAIFALMALCVNECYSSAIPMWEYLSRDEKMNHLYSMFAKQVQAYCQGKVDRDASQCKKNMMLYGIGKLNEMEESHLDQMDPYQRNANNILWDSMMNGHEGIKDERQQTLQREQYKQQNPLFRGDASSNEETSRLGSTDQYEDDEHNNYLHQGAATNYNVVYVNKPNDLENHEYLEQNTNYLMGSMVQYMMPDGSPVKDKNLIEQPQDDDREDMTIGRRRMPTMQQIYDSIRTMDEEPKIIMELPPPTTTSTTTLANNEETASPRTIRTLYGNYRLH